MGLTKQEKNRYDRHIRIEAFGEAGQEKLKAGRVLVIGAGGLGCPVIQYLTAAGVGTIGIVDADTVSVSNLQRQILYAETETNLLKAEIAAVKMHQLNSSAKLKTYPQFLDEGLADKLFPTYDIVIGATDNYGSRYLIDRKSSEHGIPFVHGAIRELEGQLSVFNYRGGMSYADVFGDTPAEPATPGGVIGAIPGIIGSMMALEAIKILSGYGEVMSGKLFLFDGSKNMSQVLEM